MRIIRKPEHQIPEEMIGLFFEDINYAADGGLYAEMLENRSFEAKEAVGVVHSFYTVDDPGYAWSPVYEEGDDIPRMQYVSGSPLSEANPHYLRFTAHAPGQGFANQAYDGIVLKKGMTYHVSFYARCVSYENSTLTVRITKDGKTSAASSVPVIRPIPYVPFSDLTIEMTVDYPPVARQIEAIRSIDRSGRCREKTWNRYETVLTAQEDIQGARFEIILDGAGIMEFDLISMIPDDAVAGIFRRDLFDALKAIHPGFIRFPGGCIIEGVSLYYRYQWKNTVGDLKDRKVIPNLWAFAEDGDVKDRDKDPLGLEARRKDSHYTQSFGLGFYEYFLLCELLGARPLPVLNIGTACQFRSPEIVDEDSPEFDGFIQDALDLIEFANGSADTRWGGLRASMGHPEPFNMDLLGIGNEQWVTEYLDVNHRYARFEKAIHAVCPEIRLVGSAGPVFGIPVFDQLWEFCRKKTEKDPSFCYAMDEHYYMPPAWFYQNADVYDSYPRTAGVFAGEYAAHTDAKENSMESALAEAAFMTGLEKNADVVRLVSYAPLFSRIGHSQWKPDLIWFDGSSVFLTPNYEVQKLYGNNMGAHTLQMDGQEKELRAEGIYLSVSETRDHEIILKAVNKNPYDYTLDLTDEAGQPLTVNARIRALTSAGNGKPDGLPEPCLVTETVQLLNGKAVLPKESFSVIRF